MVSKTFLLDDQHAFAALSGDFNPMHVDPVAARRFMYGEVVVHGIHVLLSGLEALLREHPEIASLRQVHADFRTPALLETPVDFEIDSLGPDKARIVARKEATLAMNATIEWSTHDAPAPEADIPGTPASDALAVPQELSAEALVGHRGQTSAWVDRRQLAQLLPVVADRLPVPQTAALLASTRVVGMHCPGYHSVYSELSMQFDPADASTDYRFETTDFDDRFGLASMVFEGGGQTATLKAFLRPPPQAQPTVAEVSACVQPDEFTGRRALIVGGSRGLGELVAKILATGGADVVVTYASGQADAERVVAELSAAGCSARSIPFRVGDGSALPNDLLSGWQPTHLCYFATPAIQKTDHRAFAEDKFHKLASVYVGGFADLMTTLTASGTLEAVLYPSSVFVDENPKGMAEYAAAKAAGESLCDYLAKRHRGIQFLVPRLPRLATDQTASVLSPADSAPIQYFADLLRA